MITAPTIRSREEYVACRSDADFWWPYLAQVLKRHELLDAGQEPVAGFNATYPTFVYGDVVVKLFGHFRAWRAGHAAERAAQTLISTDPEIAAPRTLCAGRLCDDADEPWPYVITSRMPGVPWSRAELSTDQQHTVAADLGRQVRRVHALPLSGFATQAAWPELGKVEAARRSSLPPHLIAQIDDYLARLGPPDRVFVHGDLVANHAYVVDGHLAGIIDWGDALVSDRHYELAQLYFSTFNCDKALFRTFLEASDWPIRDDFADRTLACALERQALGLGQHHSFDVFHTLPAELPPEDVGTLDELATELFAV